MGWVWGLLGGKWLPWISWVGLEWPSRRPPLEVRAGGPAASLGSWAGPELTSGLTPVTAQVTGPQAAS